jgi:hypothetical protein
MSRFTSLTMGASSTIRVAGERSSTVASSAAEATISPTLSSARLIP